MTVKYAKGFFRISNLIKLEGSVFWYSTAPALACGLAAAILKAVLTGINAGSTLDEYLATVLSNNIGYMAYSTLAAFLVTFRTGIAYDRFWNGANNIKKMQAEYFVTASNLVAFCRHSSAPEKTAFQHTLVRLLSMLHAVSLHQLQVGGDGVNISKTPAPKHHLIDAFGLDKHTIQALKDEECRVELIVQWVQSLTVDGIKTGVCTIPPPILSRIFQNLSNGLTSYYSAYRVTEVPFPFPYVQVTDFILLIHIVVTPIVIQSFSSGPLWAGICSFLTTFVLWSINFIAAELENPFNQTVNVLNMNSLQTEFNKRLILLLRTHTNRVSTLSDTCIMDADLLQAPFANCPFSDVWGTPGCSRPGASYELGFGSLNSTKVDADSG